MPTPWASGRTMESIHPVRDNYKFKETVSFPGAKQLFIKMDSRCATQYDYDKVPVTGRGIGRESDITLIYL